MIDGKRGVLSAIFLFSLFLNIFMISALPLVTINSPANGSGYRPVDFTVPFNGTVTSSTNTTLSNYSIYANFSGSWVVNNTNTTGMQNRSYIYTTVRLLEGTYLWAFYVCDGSSCSFSSNYTLVVDTTSPDVAISSSSIPTPVTTSQNYIYVNVTANDSASGVKNTTVFLYNLTSSNINSGRALVSSNTSTSSQFGANFTNLPQGYYFVNATTYDNANNPTSTSTTSISGLDNIAPNISITSPANGTTIYTPLANNGDPLIIYFSSSDNVFVQNGWSWNSYNSTNSSSQGSSSPATFTYPYYFSPGDYIIRIWTNDTSGNQNSSSLYFTVADNSSSDDDTTTTTTTSSGGGGGGGGGGSTTVTNSFSTSQRSQPVTINIQNSSTDVTQLQITSNKTTENASVTVTATQSAPQIDSASKIYQSFDISLGGIDDTEIINVTINFKINRTWIDTNNRDPLNVTLYRNTGTNSSPIWNPLSTNLTREDSQYYYYFTDSPGFSLYSIVVGISACDSGELRCLADNIQQCGDDNTWKTKESCEFGCSNGKCVNKAGNSVKNIFGGNVFYYILVVVIILVIILIAYFGIKRLRKNQSQ